MENRFLNILRLPVSHMHTVMVQNPSVGIMWLASPLCSFTFQLVKHFVGGPDVLTCLRIWSLRLPCLLWPNMPNTAVHMRLVACSSKMTESRLPPPRTLPAPPPAHEAGMSGPASAAMSISSHSSTVSACLPLCLQH